MIQNQRSVAATRGRRPPRVADQCQELHATAAAGAHLDVHAERAAQELGPRAVAAAVSVGGQGSRGGLEVVLGRVVGRGRNDLGAQGLPGVVAELCSDAITAMQ